MYKVLIVDDKSLIRKGIISAIDWKQLNIELIGKSENGRYALEIIKKMKPDIVITDIRMPDMDGIELLKNIYELGIQIITIVISGYDDFDYAKKAIKYGSIDYIMKPIDPAELNESLKKACTILDKNMVYSSTNEQLLRDFFQKLIKEIKYDQQEYKKLFDQYIFESCLFCVAVIKNKKNIAISPDFSIPYNNMKVCLIEESNWIMTYVFFTNIKELSHNNFKTTVEKLLKDSLKNYLNEEIITGVGQITTSLDNLTISYRNACDVAVYNIFHKNEDIISYSQIENRQSINIRLDEYESELILNITSGNAKKSVQILERLFDKVFNYSNISIESIMLIFRNLCYILIKLNVAFKDEIYDFLDKISLPGYLLKYNSIDALTQVIYNFYNFAVQKYIDEAGGKNSILFKVKNFIESNYSSDISLKELADLFHINASYLTRIFKEQEGESINTFIVKIRIENAKKILETGKVNIEKLAQSVGYEDSTYFFKVFKKVSGMTPREYFLKYKK